MRKKVKDKKKTDRGTSSPTSFSGSDPNHPPNEIDPDADYSRSYRRPIKDAQEGPTNGLDKGYGKPKKKKKKGGFGRDYTPRVRHIEDDMVDEAAVDASASNSDQPEENNSAPSPIIPSADDLKQRRKQAAKHGGFRIIGGGKDE